VPGSFLLLGKFMFVNFKYFENIFKKKETAFLCNILLTTY